MTYSLDRLTASQGPFFHLLEGAETSLEALVATGKGRPETALCIVDGSKADTAVGVFHAFAQGLQFPDYFGGNWDALDECLTDLEWLQARHVVVVIRGAGGVLPQEPDDLEILVEILITTAEAWAEAGEPERPMSFHILLQDNAVELAGWREALETQDVVFESTPC